MTRYRLTIHGTPATKGSMKCIGRRGPIGHQLIEDDKTGSRKEWRKRVAAGAAQILAVRDGKPLTGAVGLYLRFTVPRPPSAPKRRIWPITRSSGDIDKLERLVLDAITDAGLWKDDSQAVRLTATQEYVGHPDADSVPSVRLMIWGIEDEEASRGDTLPIEPGGTA